MGHCVSNYKKVIEPKETKFSFEESLPKQMIQKPKHFLCSTLDYEKFKTKKSLELSKNNNNEEILEEEKNEVYEEKTNKSRKEKKNKAIAIRDFSQTESIKIYEKFNKIEREINNDDKKFIRSCLNTHYVFCNLSEDQL